MLTTIIVVVGTILAIAGISVSFWSIVSTRRRVREREDAEHIREKKRRRFYEKQEARKTDKMWHVVFESSHTAETLKN